jgi:hypothetical protein
MFWHLCRRDIHANKNAKTGFHEFRRKRSAQVAFDVPANDSGVSLASISRRGPAFAKATAGKRRLPP